jgi:hypothetical protein
VRTVGLWLVSGILYAVALRLWMRLVSTDPEFSWAGTGYVVAIFAVLGTMAGLVTALRRTHGPRLVGTVRIVGIILSLGCFMAAGIAMLPTVVPAGLAVARTGWPRWLRGVLLVFAVAAAFWVVLTMTDLGLAHRALALAIYLALCPVEVAMVARLYAASPRAPSVG